MNINLQPVIDKLGKEINDVKGNFAADVMKQQVKDALIMFCNQNEEFAEAVLKCDKSFSECMKEVAKDFKQGISDYEAYRRAVKFYFPSAEVEFNMSIRTKQRDKILTLNLKDLMGGD